MTNTTQINDPKFLKRLRVLSIIEGISTLVLFFIAMPMKYIGGYESAVSWPGRIHGGLFVLLVVLAIIGISKVPLRPPIALLIIIAAFFPFGPFLMELKLKKLQVKG